jgi:hypothetical protein
VDNDDPRLLLARRLRALRDEQWPGMKITQPQLAQALGGSKPLSVPLISSWESQVNPKIPPDSRLEAYAALFATPRSFTGRKPCRIPIADMSDEERQAMRELHAQLMTLRNRARLAGHQGDGQAESLAAGAWPIPARGPRSRGPWHFTDGGHVTVVCAQWPPDKLQQIPYTDVNDPDYIEVLTYSDLDSLLMSYGHLRAANPGSQVEYFRSGLLPAHNYQTHLVSLGGTDWNVVTASLLNRLNLPVRQMADWSREDGQFFEVEGDTGKSQHRPRLVKVGGKDVLLEDVALFACARNPYNQNRIATICCGMYGRGTYGVVRALTDPEFTSRNTGYLESRFGSKLPYCMVVRVSVENNKTLTPDWTDEDTRLFEWSGPADAE